MPFFNPGQNTEHCDRQPSCRIIINIQCMGFNTILWYMQHKLVLGKKSGLVELSRASRFSRSLAQLATGSFQLVSSPANHNIMCM